MSGPLRHITNRPTISLGDVIHAGAPPHRRLLFERQHGLCWICLTRMRPSGTNKNSVTIDHLIPRAIGGSTELGNKLAAHKRCNSGRNHSLPKLEGRVFQPDELEELRELALKRIDEKWSQLNALLEKGREPS